MLESRCEVQMMRGTRARIDNHAYEVGNSEELSKVVLLSGV